MCARSKGNGTLVKRGKWWQARWRRGGKAYVRSTGCSSKRDAEKRLEEFTKPFREERDVQVVENLAARVRGKAAADGKRVALADLLEQRTGGLSASGIRDGTEAGYECTVGRLAKSCGRKWADEVTEADAKKFMEEVRGRCGDATFNRYLSILGGLFAEALPPWRRNPFASVKRLKVDKSKGRRELTDDEVAALEAAAREEGPELGLFFDVAARTGLRKSDVAALKWADVDFGRNVIDVLPIKTSRNGRRAVVPMHPELRKRLEAARRDGDFVFPAWFRKGSKLRYAVAAVFKKAGVKTSSRGADKKLRVETGFHALRHWFISKCVKQGVPVSVVQRMVAHSSADMSLKYSHAEVADLRLPDFAGERTVAVRVSAETAARLERARGVMDLDRYLNRLMDGKAEGPKTKSDAELDEALDEMFPEDK